MSATGIPFYIVPFKVVDFSNTKLTLDLGKGPNGTDQPQLDMSFRPAPTTDR
ncbi:hypothetical protein [Stigmatella aurantiaca]|uniref:hypothetical protein n=1 Tax=Stigmatella aurantiaca TaxID=41 RepID=UPI0002E1C856|nr:hypothetical protein [Stigmatella aurantiaca]